MKARILVVDDENEMRRMLRQMLEFEGFEVVEASDGKIAERLCHEQLFDLIITDLIMPEKEGIELIMGIRQEFPDMRFIAISGGGRLMAGEYLPIAKDLGAASTLEKPFKREDLLAAVHDLLHQGDEGQAMSSS